MFSPRYTTPPVTEHQPSSWLISNTGGTVPVGDPALVVDRRCPRSRSSRSWCRRGAGREEVDLLDRVLADVGDPEVVGGPVEREPPRVAQPDRPDLRCGRTSPTSGRCAASCPAGSLGILGPVVRVAAAAAVAQTEPQLAVGAEHHVAAVVVGERLVHRQQLAPAPGVGLVAVHGVRVDPGVALAVRVADVQVLPSAEKAMPEQAPLAVGGRLVGHVEHRVVAEAAARRRRRPRGSAPSPPRSAT